VVFKDKNVMNKDRLLELAGITTVDNVPRDDEQDDIVKFLRKHPKPTAEELKDFNPALIAHMLASFLKKFKHSNAPDEKFDKDQLEMGVTSEQEHTDNPYIAKIIAKAHLLELPDYYTRLEKMEKAAKEKPDGVR
jgi:hypothetical protein